MNVVSHSGTAESSRLSSLMSIALREIISLRYRHSFVSWCISALTS
jgi:hypothetical protein